jgi:putative drug exporter of the RND superfamily
MIERLTSFSIKYRWAVIVTWVVALIGITMANGQFGGEWRGGARLDGTDSQRAYDLLEQKMPSRTGDTSTIVFQVPAGVATKTAEIEDFLKQVSNTPVVAGVVSPFESDGQISPDGTVAFASMEFKGNTDITGESITKFTDLGESLSAKGVTTEFSGGWFTEGGLPKSEIFGLVAAVIILLIAFGSVLAAGLPLITAMFGIGIGLGTVGLWAAVVDTPDFTVEVASMIGIGVGIDYALFIVTRFREARGRGKDVPAAIHEATSTAGRAVVFAGLTVVVSLLGMILMRLKFVNGLAIGSSSSVAVAVLAAITLLPALLAVVGKRIKPVVVVEGHRASFWERWSRVLQRRPWQAAIAGMAVLLALGAPTLALRLGSADAGSMTTDQTNRRAYDLLAEGFTPGFAGPFLLVASTPDQASRDQLPAVVEKLRATSGIAYVTDVQPSQDGSAAVFTAIATTSPQDVATGELLTRLRTDVLPSAMAESNGKVYVGGTTASNADFATFVSARLPWFIGSVLVISFLLLLAMFRSILVPLKAVILDLLSIGAAYGLMVAVFQWGWFGSVFGVGKGAPIEPWAPMMLFAIVFGLSMDYEVFLLSKIRERFDATGDNSNAVAEGVAATARVITAAAAIMVFVFGFFVFGSLREIKLIGLGLATAVFIDATIVRLILVPATMELLGARNWWMPSWLNRLVPNLSIEHHEPQTHPAL